MDDKDQKAQEAHRLSRKMRRNIRQVSVSTPDNVLLIAEDAVDKVTDLDQRERVAELPADASVVEVLQDIAVEAHAEIKQLHELSEITPAEALAAKSILKQAHEMTVSEADKAPK